MKEAVLIANRGEIAVRIARTCKILGLETIAIYSEADHFSDHAKICDKAYLIGPAEPRESYLNIRKILEVARRSGARYIHPGYGFLSERPEFAEACEKSNLVFVGPRAETIRQMGDKIEARATIDALGVKRVPGSIGPVPNAKSALEYAKKVGFPVLLKARAGGGGKGMRRVDREQDVPAAFESAGHEALSAFGDGGLYVEKLIASPHHVEIQVFGDGEGRAIHLGERECSIQRRHQKIWEESPSPLLELFPETRDTMCEAAVLIAKSICYRGAGTIEFIVNERGEFYFLEMNTRLQVEHPVTEWVTGVDLVAWQLKLAQGTFSLPSEIKRNGYSIEARIYAEDPMTFLPAPGAIGFISSPNGPFIRWDAAFSGPGDVSMHYDPMIAKLSIWAPTRPEAIARLRVALDETRILPPKGSRQEGLGSLRTNLVFLKKLVRHQRVCAGDTPTDLIASSPDLTSALSSEGSEKLAIVGSLYQVLQETKTRIKAEPFRSSVWYQVNAKEGLRT